MPKIGMISADWSSTIKDENGHPVPGGAGFYRIVQPAEHLAKNGYEVVVGQSLKTVDDVICPQDLDGEFHDGCDVIVIQRWMFEYASEVIRRARAMGQVVINDVDDWFGGLRPSNSAFAASHPKNNPHHNTTHYKAALGASSLITVSTPYLAERYANLRVPIVVIPNAIDVKAFESVHTDGKPIIGWNGSTTHRSGDLEILRGVLGPFVERHDLQCFHGGSQDDHAPTFAELAGVDPERVTSAPLAPMAEYRQWFKRFDIGIAPLSDNPFNHSKSDVKILEYGAAGLPFVASRLPSYSAFGAGLIAKRPSDWVKHLERLLDPSERLSGASRAHAVAKQRDIHDRWKDWATVYEDALSLA